MVLINFSKNWTIHSLNQLYNLRPNVIPKKTKAKGMQFVPWNSLVRITVVYPPESILLVCEFNNWCLQYKLTSNFLRPYFLRSSSPSVLVLVFNDSMTFRAPACVLRIEWFSNLLSSLDVTRQTGQGQRLWWPPLIKVITHLLDYQ